MPYLFTAEVRFEEGTYKLFNLSDLASNFPFLEGKEVLGKIMSLYASRDNRLIRVDREFRMRLKREGNYLNGEFLEQNPIREMGLPVPSNVLVVVYKYQEETEEGRTELPIAEGVVLRGSVSYSYFEDEVKRILKEEELKIISEATIFDKELRGLQPFVRRVLISFEEENFSNTKTECRRILEKIKKIIDSWASIDRSKSLCQKFKSFVNSLYSFASIGGPHLGTTTRGETEVIMKSTLAILFYVNSILKSHRMIMEE